MARVGWMLMSQQPPSDRWNYYRVPTRLCSVLFPGIRVCLMHTKGIQCPHLSVFLPRQSWVWPFGIPEAAIAVQWLVCRLGATAMILFVRHDRPQVVHNRELLAYSQRSFLRGRISSTLFFFFPIADMNILLVGTNGDMARTLRSDAN